MDSYLERLQHAIASATRGMSSEDLTRSPRKENGARRKYSSIFI